jgi:hypothetical protein
MKQSQGLLLRTHLRLEKFHAAEIESAGLVTADLETLRRAGIRPYDVVQAQDNVMVNGGINAMLTLLIGGGGTSYATANARLGVGDGAGSVPTAAATDTDLTAVTGATHRQWVSATSSAAATQVLTIVSSFSSGVANFAWNEWAIDNGVTSGTGAAVGMLNHKGVALGTKTSAGVFVLTATVTES